MSNNEAKQSYMNMVPTILYSPFFGNMAAQSDFWYSQNLDLAYITP